MQLEATFCHEITNALVFEEVAGEWESHIANDPIVVDGGVMMASIFDHNQDGMHNLQMNEIEFYLLEVRNHTYSGRLVKVPFSALNKLPSLVYAYLGFTDIQRWDLLVFYNLTQRSLQDVASPGIEQYLLTYHPLEPNKFVGQIQEYYLQNLINALFF